MTATAASGQDVEQLPVQGALWQESPCPQLVLDAEAAVVLDGNETFWRWSGLERGRTVGTPFARLLPVGDRILWSTHYLPKLDEAGQIAEVSLQVTGEGGVRRAAFLTASRSPTAGGHVLVALFGATERRRYEEDLLAAKRRAEASDAERARAEERLQRLAHHDPVTGLLNRRGLHDALREVLLGRTSGADAPAGLEAVQDVSVLFIDLDGFKQVNDSIGHSGGDELLRVVAQRLQSCIRSSAVLARFAGDEFVVVDTLPAHPALLAHPDLPVPLEQYSATSADALSRRVLTVLAEPAVISGVEVVVSASIGVARSRDLPSSFAGDLDGRAEALLQRADAAMYEVKRSGRGSWLVHDPAADPAADRLRLMEQLRHAVPAGELCLHYQPRIDLRTTAPEEGVGGRTVGVEALVRWQHPQRGLLGPGDFIEVAEDSGLIREVGAWVLRTALAQAAAWQAEGHELEMAVNVSARQLVDPALVAVVTAELARHGVPASRLVLEITETALMVDPDAAARTLGELADLGCRIAVDDFGTGYASLTYLRRFPVHELKIDKSFVAGITAQAGDGGDRAIVAGCIQMAHALGLTSVAEGVETTAQRDVLGELGCQVAQGFLFAPPRAPQDFRFS